MNPSNSPSAWVCNAACFGAALWTVCCHAVVAFGGSLRDVLITVGVALTVLAAAAVWGLTRSASPAPATPPPRDADFQEPGAFPPVARGVGAAVGVAALVGYAWLDDALVLWWVGTAAVLFGLAVTARFCIQPTLGDRPLAGPGWETALWGMGLGSAAIVLNFHLIDLDTSFYVSIAVAAADAPDAPLMVDTIHGIDGLGLHMPAHRVHTFEIFNGALSFLTGLPAITCYHVAVAGMSALLVPLAHGQLFRILTPRHWPWSVLAFLAVVIGSGATMAWYSNFSIIRIFHGKSVYLSVFLPLIYTYGLRYGADPSAGRWLRLAAAQVAAVGCSSSALWSAPVAAGLAVACAVRWDRRTPRILAFAVLSSFYVVGVGLSLVGDLAHVADRVAAGSPPGEQLHAALKRTFGGGALELVALAAVFLTWALRVRGPAQRFATLIPAAILLLLLNPYASDEVSRYMTGPSHWRVLWSLPVPILLALLLTAPLQLDRSRNERIGGWLTAAGAVAGFVLFVPPHSALSPHNRVVFGHFAQLKVPIVRFGVARQLSLRAPQGSMVVAPQRIALRVIAFHHHPTVTYAREVYLQRVRAELGEEEAERRMLLSELVSYPPKDIEKRIRMSDGFARRSQRTDAMLVFRRGLEELGVRGVCLNPLATRATEVRTVLSSQGFFLETTVFGYEIWIQPDEIRTGTHKLHSPPSL